MVKEKAKNQSTATNNPKVFDVAKPGETPADATARPLIGGHTSMINQDPMVVDPENDSIPDSPLASKGATIKPLENSVEVEEDVVAPAETSENDEQATEENQAPAAAESQNSDESFDDSGTAAVDMLADEAGKKQSLKQAQQQIKRDEEIEKIINSRTYNVHTKTPPGKRTARSVLFLLLLIAVGAAVVYFLYGPGKDTISL